MPQAVTHVLIALIIVELIRDYFIKDKKKFPLHYVLIAGIAGLLPDIDIALYWILHWFGFTLQEVHRTFSHNLFVPVAFLLLAGLTLKLKSRKLKSKELKKEFGKLGKHHLKIYMIFLMIFIGSFIHLLLDFLLSGNIMPFYPVSTYSIGLNFVDKLPIPLSGLAIPTLDAILLVLWLIHEEFRHKISSFI